MGGQLRIPNTESKGAYFENWGNNNCPKPFLILMDFVHALLNGKSVNISSQYKKDIFYSDNNRSLDTTGHGAK